MGLFFYWYVQSIQRKKNQNSDVDCLSLWIAFLYMESGINDIYQFNTD